MEKKDTKICKHCKEEIAKSAKRCPKCGGKLGMPGWVKVIIVIVVILVCVVSCMNSCSKAVDEAVNETKNAYKDKNGKTSFKLNETFENAYTKITMTEVILDWKKYDSWSKPASGNKIVAAKFEVENIGDNDEEYVSSFDFNMSADNVDCEEYIWSGNDYKTISATLGKGKKTIGWVFHEVPKDAKKIVIDYNANFWQDGTAIEFIVQE